MKISYETRVKQRLAIKKSGSFLINVALLLGFLAFVLTTFSTARIGLTLAGFAVIMAPFGAALTIIFSRIGWSRNLLIDLLFNQASIVTVIIGFLTICFYIGFFTIYDKNHPTLLNASIISLASSMILLALGLRFSETG